MASVGARPHLGRHDTCSIAPLHACHPHACMVAAAPTRRTGLLLLLGSLGWPSFPLARLGFAGQLVHVTAREGACLPILATASRPSHSYGCHCHITHLPLPRTCPQAPFPAGAFRVRHRHFWSLFRSDYQSPASSTFLSEQTNHQQSANSTFLSQQISTSHQPPAKRTGCWFMGSMAAWCAMASCLLVVQLC
jgi:hypothetical protein